MRHFALGIGCLTALGCAVVLAFVTPLMARDWRPANSGLRIQAELESYDGKTVKLKLDSGMVWTLPIEKLSKDDQAYLKKTYPNGKEGPKKSKTSPAKTSPAKSSPAKSSPDKAGAGKPAVSKAPSTTPAAAKAPDANASDVSVSTARLTVTKPSGANAGLVPGTHVTLFVSSPSKTLLRVDAEKTKIVCADDRANNLSKPLPGSEASTDEGPLTLDVAPDGKSGTIVFDFPRAPTNKATRIRLKGELHLVCGSNEDPEPVSVPLALIVSLGL